MTHAARQPRSWLIFDVRQDMPREYKIMCTPAAEADLSALFRKMPSPISRPQMREIYNYRIEKDGYYFIDQMVDRKVAAVAFQLLVDAALSTSKSITVVEL